MPKRRITISSFPPIHRGDWVLSFSITSLSTIMVAGYNLKSQEFFLRFFTSEKDAETYIDSLIWDDDQKLDY